MEKLIRLFIYLFIYLCIYLFIYLFLRTHTRAVKRIIVNKMTSNSIKKKGKLKVGGIKEKEQMKKHMKLIYSFDILFF